MNRRFTHKLAALGLAILLSAAGAAYAQEDTGNVFVVVSDTEGALLPGVTVTLTGYGAPRVQVTNAQGEVRFLGLDPGSYGLTAELDSFSTVEYPNVDVRVARSTSLEVSLSNAVEEVITVTSESPLLDERKLSTGTTISQIELEKIPTARDPWSVLTQTPGVIVDRVNVGGNESGQQSSFTAPGVSDAENAFLVDGVEITDMAAIGSSATYYDFDQFTEMQFSTGGTDVTKSAAGVSVNLVTKRGTNEFRGSSRFLRTDDDFFAGFLEQDVPIRTAGDPDLKDPSLPGSKQTGFIGNSINQVTEYGFEAGGPVVQDKLWFWGSFGTNDIKNRTGGATAAAIQSDDTILENTAVKINAQLSGSNSAVASWNNGNKQKFGRNAGPTRPQPTTWDQRGPTALYKVEDTHVFNSNFFLSGTWSHVDGGFSLTSKAVIAAGGITNAPETAWDSNGVWQNSFYSGPSSRPSDEVKLDGSYFFNTGTASHEVKFGGRLREFETVSPFHWPGRDVFVVDLELFGAPAGSNTEWVVAHRGETPLISQEYTSFWVQDTISTGNLTINAGLRYDLQEGRNEQYSIAGNPAFPDLLPALSFAGEAAPFDFADITPRLGLTYALGEDRKTLLRASFSQFPEQLETDDLDRLNPLGDAYAYISFIDADNDLFFDDGEEVLSLDGFTNFDPDNPGAVTSPNRVDPGLDAPITSEAILGVEHALLPEFVVGLNYTYRLTEDILADDSFELLRELIVDPSGAVRPATASDFVSDGFVTGTLPDGTPYSQEIFALACGSACRTGGTIMENTDREIEYSGLSLNFIKRLSNRWMLRGYVNLGESEWNVGSSYLANYDPNDEEGGFDNNGELFAVQAAGSGAKQDVFLQSGWQYNVNGLYQVAPDRPWGFNVSGNVFGREGTPLPYYHRVTGSDGIQRDIQVTNAIDSFRTDDILTVDARVEKEFAATAAVGFTFSLDIFNLFDESFELQRRRQTNTGQYDFLTETLSPRIYRLGVRMSWR